MTKLSKIFDIYTKQAELIFEATDLLLQKDDSFRNLGEAGSQVEIFVRETLRKLLPARFRLTSGYIVSKSNIENDNDIPQCDLIIADAFIPPLYKITGDIEVVPVEAVCGVIEIKRSLFKSSSGKILEKAIEHLVKIDDVCGLTKACTQQVLPLIKLSNDPGNSISTGMLNNPLVGVISLELGYRGKKTGEKLAHDVAGLLEKHHSMCDFIYCFDGFSMLPQKGGGIHASGSRKGENVWHQDDTNNRWNVNYARQGGVTKSQIFARAIGFVSAYLSLQAGKAVDLNDYFFNTKIFGEVK